MTALDTPRDVADGLVGALVIAINGMTPFLRGARSRWGVTREDVERPFPGDRLVAHPAWGWTHAVSIEAPAERVWPWVAQIGQGKAGFYSYQWLENLAGCDIRNADALHEEWINVAVGDELRLHPSAPALTVRAVEPGRFFVASDVADPLAAISDEAKDPGGRWVHASWLFLVEPQGPSRCRLVSRYRVAYGRDRKTRMLFGTAIAEPVGSAMDRRMLLGVKQRAEAGTRG